MNSFFKNENILSGRVVSPVALFESALEPSVLTAMAHDAWCDFPWEDRGAPRRECFYSRLGLPYTYGSGAGIRTYYPKDAPSAVETLTAHAERACGVDFELCFANGYAGPREHLGWHADDSDTLDDKRPIAVMSLGAEREIWVKPRGADADAVEKILLPSGSLFVMSPGMQDTHVHRIPKHGAECSYRVSLTWRGAA